MIKLHSKMLLSLAIVTWLMAGLSVVAALAEEKRSHSHVATPSQAIHDNTAGQPDRTTGDSTVVVEELNTGGTIRVHNLANLKRVLDAIAVVGLVAGVVCVSLGLRRLAAQDTINKSRKALLVGILASLMIGLPTVVIMSTYPPPYLALRIPLLVMTGPVLGGILAITGVPKGYRGWLVLGTICMVIGAVGPWIIADFLGWSVERTFDPNLMTE